MWLAPQPPPTPQRLSAWTALVHEILTKILQNWMKATIFLENPPQVS